MHAHIRSLLAVVALGMAQAASAAPLPLLRITDLEAVIGVSDNLRVVDVNNAGQVLAYQLDGSTYLWHPDQGVKVIEPLHRTSLFPHALSDNGAVVGSIYRLDDGRSVPFIWRPAQGLEQLPVSGADGGDAMAINAQGQIAGEGTASNGKTHLLVGSVRRGLFDPRPGQRGYSHAGEINSAGHVAGSTTGAAGCCRSAMLVGEHGRVRLLGSLAAPGEDESSQAHGLNDRDEVVGRSDVGGYHHAFYWSEATGMIDLQPSLDPAALVSSAWDINVNGQVVGGWSSPVASASFYWDAEHGGMNLNDRLDPADPLTPRARITDSYVKINDRGQIVTFATIDGSMYRPVLLSPVTP